MIENPVPPPPPYECRQIFYRAARSSGWIKNDGSVKKQAFNRSAPPYDRRGLSGSPFREHCEDGLPDHARGKGVITLKVGYARDLGLDITPDSPTHGNIEGIPDRDEDRGKHDFLAGQLAKLARSLR